MLNLKDNILFLDEWYHKKFQLFQFFLYFLVYKYEVISILSFITSPKSNGYGDKTKNPI